MFAIQKDKGEKISGKLSPVAASILMGLLYAARMARYDLLRGIGHLARFLTKWTEEHDKQFHRLMCGVKSTLGNMLVGWVGDVPALLGPVVYADADLAGCTKTQKSTSGIAVFIEGLNTRFPINATATAQSSAAHSTPEAEIIAADKAVRTEVVPTLDMTAVILRKDCRVTFRDDNTTMIRCILTGKNPP